MNTSLTPLSVWLGPEERFVAELSTDGVLQVLERTHVHAVRALIDIMTTRHANLGTRSQYRQAIRALMVWMLEKEKYSLLDLRAADFGAWRDEMAEKLQPLTVQSRFAAVRSLFDDLVIEGILPANPASRVKVIKGDYSVGKTSTLSAQQVRRLVDSIKVDTLVGLRDRALIATLMYSTMRISAALTLTPKSMTQEAGATWFRVVEKRSKHRLVPIHEELFPLIMAWLDESDIGQEPDLPIFRAFGRKRQTDEIDASLPQLRPTALTRQDAWKMVQRRAASAGIPDVSCHTFRATGLTVALLNGASLDEAQDLAGHASVATTRLYDRRKDRKMVGTVNRIRF